MYEIKLLTRPRIDLSPLTLLSANPTKQSNTLKLAGNLRTNSLSVFDHFVGLVLQGVKNIKFNQNFPDIISSCHSCCLEIELTSHFILRSQNFRRNIFMDKLPKLNKTSQTRLPLYGDRKFENKIKSILLGSLIFLLSTNQFEDQLMRQIYVYLQVPVSCLLMSQGIVCLFVSLFTVAQLNIQVLFLVCDSVISILVLLLLTLVCTDVYPFSSIEKYFRKP